jgi:hypothetical protein
VYVKIDIGKNCRTQHFVVFDGFSLYLFVAVVFLQNALQQTTYVTPCPTAIIEAVSMSVALQGPSQFQWIPQMTVTAPSISLYHRQLIMTCCMKPQALFGFHHFHALQLFIFTEE